MVQKIKLFLSIFTIISLISLPIYSSSSYDMLADNAILAEYGSGEFFSSNPNTCTVCHSTSLGGLGTAVTPFGTDFRMVGGGTFGMNQAQLQTAFLAIEDLDPDNDTYTNAEEFMAGTNPNSAASFPSAPSSDPPPSGDDPSQATNGIQPKAPRTGGCMNSNGFYDANGDYYVFESGFSNWIYMAFISLPCLLIGFLRRKP